MACGVTSKGTVGATPGEATRKPPTSSRTDESATVVENPSQRARNPTEVSIANEPVDLIARKDMADSVRSKFSDIFEVERNKAICTDFEHIPFERFSDEVDTVGCLSTKKSLEFYRALNASPYVLDIIENGHHSVFSEEVKGYEFKNNGSFKKHIDFAVPELLKLIKTGRVEIVQEKPEFINPLHVVDQVVKKRLILDCSYLNNFIEVPAFKYEDHKAGLCYFKKGGYMINFDLKDGYNQILIHKDFRKYLSFQFEYKGKVIYARYVCGCFGLKDLPYVFTKIFRPLIKHWRACGIPVVQFLDDGWACFRSLTYAESGSEHIRKDLLRLGAVWSIKKCEWVPTQKLDWIGFTWDCSEGTLRVKEKRILKILSTCEKLISMDRASARVLASFTGQIISMMPVVGDLSRFHTRFSQIAIAEAETWDSQIALGSDIRAEVNFWKENVQSLNVRYVFEVQVPKRYLSVFGDASSSGCGSFISGTDDVAARLFSPEECEKHSTWRELENLRFSIESLSPFLTGKNVKFLTDSQSAQRIMKCGSMKHDCHDIAKKAHDICVRNGISLDVEWISRNDNEIADQISREPEILDTDDWGLSWEFFHFLEKRYKPFSLDGFANSYNNKVDRFYSLYHVPGSSGVDAFSFDWNLEFTLLVPPVSIIGRVLQHLYLCRAEGILVVPCWPSSYFWPMLINEFSPYIQDILKVKGSNILVQGYNQNSLLGSGEFKGFMLIVHLDCSKSV